MNYKSEKQQLNNSLVYIIVKHDHCKLPEHQATSSKMLICLKNILTHTVKSAAFTAEKINNLNVAFHFLFPLRFAELFIFSGADINIIICCRI